MGSKKIIFVLLFSSWLFACPTIAQATTYYVSPTGNNSTGLSWATAWNELNQINWSVINPGDVIELDGGPVACTYPTVLNTTTNTPTPTGCGLVYNSILSVKKSGLSTNPIVIRLSQEAGHNGTVRIFGGRTYPVPYCDQTDHPGFSGSRSYGVNFDQNVNGSNGWVTLDGGHWAGIMVYGHSAIGITLENSNCGEPANLPSNIIVRNVEIFDNGSRGVRPAGTNLLFERNIIHDNGQDSFQVDSQFTNLTIKRSWLFVSRMMPGSNDGNSFNGSCTHSDGVQIYAGGAHSGFTVEDSIVGPGHMHSFMLGDYSTANSCIGTTTVDNVTIKNSLLVGNHGINNEDNIHTKANSNVLQNNYVLENVTSVRGNNQPIVNNEIKYGNGRKITNSIFSGGISLIINNPTALTNNFCYQVSDANNVCTTDTVNPQYKDSIYDGVRNDPTSIDTDYANFDFTITNPAIPASVGSTITSVATLLSEPTSSPSPSPKPGDANGDNKVDGLDYVVWLNHYNQSISGPANGDFNGSGKVDGVDYVLWVGNYGK